MLDPSGFRIVLTNLLVGLSDRPAGLGIEDRAAAGCSLIDGENKRTLLYFNASTNALPNASAASGPDPVINLPSFSTALAV